MLLGLARRTARQVEKASPFYLEEPFAFSQIEARMVAGFFRWNQPRERRERACPSLLEERVLREEPIGVPPNAAHPHVRHVEWRIAVRRVWRFAVTRGQAGKGARRVHVERKRSVVEVEAVVDGEHREGVRNAATLRVCVQQLREGKKTHGQLLHLHMMLSCTPHDVADCANA